MASEKSDKIGNSILRLIAIYYIAIGIAEVGYFAIENFVAPPHILVLGLLSLITAYTIFTMKKWTLPLVVALFFVGITFGAATLANSITLQTFGGAMLFHLTLIAYMIMHFLVSVYIVTRRESFN